MTYNVFSGTLNPAQPAQQPNADCTKYGGHAFVYYSKNCHCMQLGDFLM